MGQRAALIVEILEKIGVPLIGAVGMVGARRGAAPEAGADADNVKQDAEQVAGLLNKAVQISLDLGRTMDLKDSDADNDAVRLALVGLAGQLVAGQYGVSGRAPNDNEIKRLLTGLEAVLTFSDNFTAQSENTARLAALDIAKVPGDESQTTIQYVHYMVPVVNAVAAFSFGRPQQKLVQEVAERLTSKSRELARDLSDASAPEAGRGQAELRVLGTLATLYVSCHIEYMNSLLTMDEKARNELTQKAGGVMPMEGVWEAFDKRVQMVSLLGAAALSDGAATETGPAAAPQSGAVSPASPPPAEASGAPENPMAMFAKKPAAAPEASSGAPASSEGTEAAVAGSGNDGNNQGDSSGNPMAFFRSGDKKDTDGNS